MNRWRRQRRGLMSLEVALSLAVGFTIAASALLLGMTSCGNLYHVIAVWIGSPYL